MAIMCIKQNYENFVRCKAKHSDSNYMLVTLLLHINTIIYAIEVRGKVTYLYHILTIHLKNYLDIERERRLRVDGLEYLCLPAGLFDAHMK